MANDNTLKNKKTNTLQAVARKKELEFEAEVLFQRLGGKWYAFSVVEEECLMTEVTESEVQKRMTKKNARAA